MNKDSLLTVKVWGKFALFTRPEFSAERVSYPVMTPSAARGILEQIHWKPEFRWIVHQIQVLKEIRHFSIVRNEISTHQSDRTVATWAKDGIGNYYADEHKNRSQRHSLCLRDVAYIIKAQIDLKPHETNIVKHRDQFCRRVEKGQCFQQPYLGTREFSAFFSAPDGTEKPIEHTDDLGLMLFDVEITEDSQGKLVYLSHDANGKRVTKGRSHPKFFPARLEKGVLNIPTSLYEQGVYRCS
jgi:CRISPR-associated protein Cas5d